MLATGLAARGRRTYRRTPVKVKPGFLVGVIHAPVPSNDVDFWNLVGQSSKPLVVCSGWTCYLLGGLGGTKVE